MNFGVVVFNQVEELDFVGPWEMLSVWSQQQNGPKNCMIVGETTAPIRCSKGLSVNPDVSFPDCPPLDYLLIPGGMGTRKEVDNPAMLDFIAKQTKNCKAVLSVCTGSFILHAAGLLNGKNATTHWASLDCMRALGDVEVIEQRFVRDGTIWTSAGVSAGIDLMLAFIAATAGDEIAGKVQFYAEYYPNGVRYGDAENNPEAPAYLNHQ